MSAGLPKSPSYVYRATVYSVTDGDTIRVRADLGFHASVDVALRLYGINTPELKGETYAAGLAAKNHLESRIRKFAVNWDQSRPIVLMRSHKSRQQDKYGRWLAELIGFDQGTGSEVLINEMMVNDGHAVRYMLDEMKP